MSSQGSDDGDVVNDVDPRPLSLSATASDPHCQASPPQKILSSQASSHSCLAEPGGNSSEDGVDGGLSSDERADLALLSPHEDVNNFNQGEERNMEGSGRSAITSCSITSFDEQADLAPPLVSAPEDVNNFDQGAQSNMRGSGRTAVTSCSSTSRKISNESLERQIITKLEQEENNATANDDDLCISVGHQVYSQDEESSRAADAGEISDLFRDEGSTADEALIPAAVDGGEYGVITATSMWAKEKNSPDSGDVGAVQVDEQAPQLNRRFFRGLRRASMVARDRIRRRARARGGSQDDDGRGSQVVGRGIDDSIQGVPAPPHSQDGPSRDTGIRESMVTALDAFIRASNQESLVTAHLVDEDEGNVQETVVAERVGWFEQKWKTCGPIMTVSIVFLLVSFSVAVGVIIKVKRRMDALTMTDATLALTDERSEAPSMQPSLQPSFLPSLQPSSLPSHDPRPTLEIIQTRGHVRCGVRSPATVEGFQLELCRAITVVLLGNPDNFTLTVGHLNELHDRTVDVSVRGYTHTIEREIKEERTGVGFAFSSSYYYDGMAYFGNESYVECAEKLMRYDDCSSLQICVFGGSTHQNLVQSWFPSDFIEVIKSLDLAHRFLRNGTCNVLAFDRSYLLKMESIDEYREERYIVGDKLLSKEPLAAVTRIDDYEFSNIINLIVNALFYGEEKGLTKDLSRCGKDSKLTGSPFDLNFLNGVYCVGNYGEMLSAHYEYRHKLNRVNNGTTGMLYAIPFGDLETQRDDPTSGGALLSDLRNQGSLNCGVVVPDGFLGNITDSKGLVGLSRDYCHTLAAALFNGKFEAVTIRSFPENDGSSFAALLNGTIDVLAGGSSQWKHHFEMTRSITGFRFSTPYYFGVESRNGDMDIFSMVTREEDVMFSLFVKCVVLSTIHVQDQIMSGKTKYLPLMSLFGGNFNWAFRDAISYSGSYDDMYTRNFGYVAEKDRGRNVVNSNTGPQIHSLPSLDAILQYGSDGNPF